MIEILSYKEINKGAFLGSVNIKVKKWGDFIINKITVFSKDGRKWISFPQETYEENGIKKYFSLNRFESREDSDKFQKAVLEALDAFLAKLRSNEVVRVKNNEEDLPF